MVVIQLINEGGNESMAKWDEIPYETINLGNNHSWLLSSLSKKTTGHYAPSNRSMTFHKEKKHSFTKLSVNQIKLEDEGQIIS